MKGHVDDASAIFYNPAGLVQPRQFEILLGDTIIVPAFKFESVTVAKTPVPPPHFYAAYGINDDVSVGVGLFSPFGLRAEDAPWLEWECMERTDVRERLLAFDCLVRTRARRYLVVGALAYAALMLSHIFHAMIFTRRDQTVRVISFRKANDRERRRYEKR